MDNYYKNAFIKKEIKSIPKFELYVHWRKKEEPK